MFKKYIHHCTCGELFYLIYLSTNILLYLIIIKMLSKILLMVTNFLTRRWIRLPCYKNRA